MSDAVVVSDLVVRYGRVTALDGASMSVAAGEALGIVGPNGSGKSTLLKTIAGLLQPASGTVRVFGRAPGALPAGSIAYVPQIEDVDWTFPATVRDVVSMGRFPRLGMLQRFGAADRSAVSRALELLHMMPFAKRHIAALSGGQQQRVFVARAIAQEPKLLLLDEPTTGVDAQTEESLREVVRELAKGGLPIVMTTHDLDRAADWFDRLMVLDRRVLGIGKPEEVLESGAYAGIREHTHTHGHMRVDA
ncbi:MAG: metal ABC transporter ATP-binding protein [Candidatus Baltobacteraceae bacterium]